MRHLPGLSLLVIASFAHGAPAQQAGPQAGATRPNLKVLQSLPESQLFPLMNMVATELGVRCDFCHVQENPNLSRTPSNVGGWVWARDDKPTKRKAREMMQMVVELNATKFGGEHKVTCYTCHQGSTKPVRTPPLPPAAAGIFRTPPPLSLPSADRVWANYVAAVGPGGRFAPGTGIILSGWDDRSEGRYGSVEVVATADRYRLTLTTPEGKTIQGLDSLGAWFFTRDSLLRLASPEDLARVRRIAARFRPIKERPESLQVTGVERVTGHDAYVAAARINPVTTWTAYFDVVTGLLRREMWLTETLLLPLQDQVDYDDYREVNGVQVPFLVRTSTGAPYDMVTRAFLQIRPGVPVSDSLLRPPR